MRNPKYCCKTESIEENIYCAPLNLFTVWSLIFFFFKVAPCFVVDVLFPHQVWKHQWPCQFYRYLLSFITVSLHCRWPGVIFFFWWFHYLREEEMLWSGIPWVFGNGVMSLCHRSLPPWVFMQKLKQWLYATPASLATGTV